MKDLKKEVEKLIGINYGIWTKASLINRIAKWGQEKYEQGKADNQFKYCFSRDDMKEFLDIERKRIMSLPANKIKAEERARILKKTDAIAEKLYGINSQIISLQWIGLKKEVTEKDIRELNRFLGNIIKELREIKQEANKSEPTNTSEMSQE